MYQKVYVMHIYLQLSHKETLFQQRERTIQFMHILIKYIHV